MAKEFQWAPQSFPLLKKPIIFAYFDPKKVHFKAKINSFLSFMLINLLVQTMQTVGRDRGT